MRWDALFADIEGQFAAAEAADRTALVQELTRAERATITVADRIRRAQGSAVAVVLVGGERVDGVVVDSAETWLLLVAGARQYLVPLAAVGWFERLERAAAPPGPGVLRRLSLGHVLRALSRDRVRVRVSSAAGDVVGVIDGVGSDYVDVTAWVDSDRPDGPVRTVPMAALRVVASA